MSWKSEPPKQTFNKTLKYSNNFFYCRNFLSLANRKKEIDFYSLCKVFKSCNACPVVFSQERFSERFSNGTRWQRDHNKTRLTRATECAARNRHRFISDLILSPALFSMLLFTSIRFWVITVEIRRWKPGLIM